MFKKILSAIKALIKHFFGSIIGLSGWLFSLGFTILIIGGSAGFLVFNHYSKDLPDYSQLAKYDPPTITRLYAADGRLLAEYATEKRVFVPLSAIPKRVIHAFISAEDKNFYEHEGIDFTGIVRAVRDNVINYGHGKSLVGGSTITQQVVKNPSSVKSRKPFSLPASAMCIAKIKSSNSISTKFIWG